MPKRENTSHYEQLGRMFENLLISGSVNTKRLLWLNFLKGLAYGFGLFLAGTLLIGLLIWVLNQFQDVPLLGPLLKKLLDYLQT